MRPEDTDLAPEQFPELNMQFYATNPASYFKRRLHLLLIAAGASDTVQELLTEGVRYEGIISMLEPPEDTDAEERERQAFLTTEAEVLLHHASEALLRLYFAHVERPQCPWLECARLRSFTKFNQQVDAFRQLPLRNYRQDVAEVFLGSMPDESNSEAVEAVETIGRLLKVLADRLLEDKNLYNSAKHGLAVIAGESSIAISSDGGELAFGSQGQSLSFLETRDISVKEPKWHVTTRWVNTKQAMWLTMMAITEMMSLWSVAKYRYADVRIEGVEIIKKESLDDVLFGDFANRQPIPRFSTRLAYRPGL
jgi:hypothetical protein